MRRHSWGEQRRRPIVVDTVLALGLLALGVFYYVLLERLSEPETPMPLLLGVVLLAFEVLPLALRRRFPLAVLAIVTVPDVILGFHIPDGIVAPIGYFLALYSAGAYGTGRWRDPLRAVSVVVGTGFVAYAVFWRDPGIDEPGFPIMLFQLFTLLIFVFYLGAAWFLGDSTRTRCRHEVELANRAEELAAAQAIIADQAVEAERVRIARELHDVLAHHVSVMGVQAGAARRVLARSPEQATETLHAIEEASRQAVTELHRLLGFLRPEGERLDGDTEPSTAPPPSLARLDRLVVQMADAGLDVTLRVEGMPVSLPASVDLSAYRVVQEALTNALKHAGPGAAVIVTLVYDDDALAVKVVDDGRGRQSVPLGASRADGAGGRGLVGMRERVGLHGGQLRIGPRARGGFEVAASFPTGAR